MNTKSDVKGSLKILSERLIFDEIIIFYEYISIYILFDSFSQNSSASSSSLKKPDIKSPLAEILRPVSFEEYVGQEHVLGEDKMLRLLMNQNEIPSLILWGPPGCGKVSLICFSLCFFFSNACRIARCFYNQSPPRSAVSSVATFS